MIDIDGLIAKYFPGMADDREFRANPLRGMGCQVMQELHVQLKGRHSRKGAGCILRGDYATLWALEAKHVPDIASVAKALMAMRIADMVDGVKAATAGK